METIRTTHSINNTAKALRYLNDMNYNYNYGTPRYDLNKAVLKLEEFRTWPAASHKHQAYSGGLLVHTAQVLSTALAIAGTVTGSDYAAIVTAVIWHDFAKLKDYEWGGEQGTWVDTKHRYMQRHVVRSYADFREAAHAAKVPEDQIDFISHLILSHHGRLEWGSPVEPMCPEAWAIHAADMLSARYCV